MLLRIRHYVAVAALAPLTLSAQELASASRGHGSRTEPARAGAATAVAVRATQHPIIDGKDDDAVWATAQVIDGFRTFDPAENGDPRFRTEARVAFDEHNLYVLIRAYDPHPDSIVSLLSRRDVRTP